MSRAANSDASERPGVSRLEFEGARMAIPHEYLPPRLRNNSLEWSLLPNGALTFAFLMPDGAPANHVNHDKMFPSEYVLKGQERALGRFVIYVRSFTVVAADEQYVSPAQAFRNRIALGVEFLEPEFGLQSFSERPISFATYGSAQRTEPEVMFDCGDQKSADRLFPGDMPLCNGVAYFPSKRHEYRMSFPAENFAEWSRIVATVDRLVTGWTENGR